MKKKVQSERDIAESREMVRDIRKEVAQALLNMSPEQQDVYRRAMTNRAFMEGEKIIERLAEIALDKSMPPNVQVNAGMYVIDRAIGKTIQEVKIQDESITKHLSTGELIELAGRLGVAVGIAKERGSGTIIEAEVRTLSALSEAD